jgi:hypothetical protein
LICAICKIRKARRYCPGVSGEICTICCGTGREETVDCPLPCEYLREAHRHEKATVPEPAAVPNTDIEIKEGFLVENETLLAFLAITIFEGATAIPGVTDWDVRDAFDALIRTYRTRQSGLYYETRPENAHAARIAGHLQQEIAKATEQDFKARGATAIRDSTVLGLLAFLQRLEYTYNNGRKRSRAFLDFLQGFFLPLQESEGEDVIEKPRLIV